MELLVFRLFVTCYLTCILYRNAVSGSTLTKVFPSINNTSQPDTRISEIGNIERLIEMEMRPDGITSKDNLRKLETPREPSLMQDLLMKTGIFFLNNFKKCSRYCIQQLGIGKGFEDINLVLSLADQSTHGDDYFSLENSSNFKILRYLSTDINSTILDCKIYLNLDCDMERNLVGRDDELYSNLKFNPQNIEILKNYFSNIIPEFSKKLEHRTNLRGYTETNFQTDANVTEIVINILGNLTRVVLTIPTNKMVQRPGIVMSLASIYNTKGVAIGARNLPDRWCMKLTGVESSKYNFDVIAYYGRNKENNTRDDIIDVHSTSKVNRKKNFDDKGENHTTHSKTSTIIKRSAEIMDSRRNNDEITADDESTAAIDKNNINNFVLRNNSLISYGEFKILPNIKEQQQKIQARSSEITSLNEDIDAKMKSPSKAVPMQMDQNQKLSQINEDPFERKKILLDVNANSKLIAAPGTIHRVYFDATNNCILPVRYSIEPRSSPFKIYNIQPLRFMWLYPGQTDQVAVDILVPRGTQETINTLTLSIVGTQILEKTVHIFVQNEFTQNTDNVKPTIEYWFNSNCAGKLDKDRCEKSLWSADITVQDHDSGLKRVVAIPNGLYPSTKYISGTKDRVTFYYWSTCCTPSATITAIDISENVYTRTIDVTAWDNLSQGEIAAIVLGALLLLFLLILVIVAIVYCVRKRSSHDLPYTQRYGSRSQPARAERTSF